MNTKKRSKNFEIPTTTILKLNTHVTNKTYTKKNVS